MIDNPLEWPYQSIYQLTYSYPTRLWPIANPTMQLRKPYPYLHVYLPFPYATRVDVMTLYG